MYKIKIFIYHLIVSYANASKKIMGKAWRRFECLFHSLGMGTRWQTFLRKKRKIRKHILGRVVCLKCVF